MSEESMMSLEVTPLAVKQKHTLQTDNEISRVLPFTATTRTAAPTPGRYLLSKQLVENLKVFLRLKPEHEGEPVCKIDVLDAESVRVSGISNRRPSDDTYSFSKVLGPETTQEQVYKFTAEPIVQSLFDGQNGLIFAYGVTSSGEFPCLNVVLR
jgi:hypothetical protein